MHGDEYGRAVSVYTSAVNSFASLVRDLPSDRWDGPGLGAWDMRALVGHASRSIITVIDYSTTTAAREDISSPQQYYAAAMTIAAADPAGAEERGRQAGRDLGANPAATVDVLAKKALKTLADTEDRLITVIGGLGIRLSQYLPTRTFELAVHSLDIAAAADRRFTPPADVLTDATLLAARIAIEVGEGPALLMALTGRRPLPLSFSVV